MPEGLGVPLAFAVYVPTLALRMTAGFFRFLGTRRTAVKTFRDALVAGGMRRGIAGPLARAYHEAGSVAEIGRDGTGLRGRVGNAPPGGGSFHRKVTSGRVGFRA